MAHIGKANNILFKGGGVGVFFDERELNASRRYKAFGSANYEVGQGVADLGVSADGLRWFGVEKIEWPSPQRFDCHNNLVFDGSQYVATTRDGFETAPGRTIAMLT